MTWAEERALSASSTERPDRVGLKLFYRLASWYLCAYGLYGVVRDGNTLSLGMSGGSKAVSQPLPETLGKLMTSVLTIGGAILFARLARPQTSARPGIAGR